MPCCVRGYHVYKEMWEAVIGEVLECHREPTNATDRYAVAVTKAATIVGHLPRKLSKVVDAIRAIYSKVGRSSDFTMTLNSLQRLSTCSI